MPQVIFCALLCILFTNDIHVNAKTSRAEGTGTIYLQLVGISKAHIPPETAFVFGTQREQKGDKQQEINMPDANPTRSYPMQTIFHWVKLELTLVCVGSAIAFGYQLFYFYLFIFFLI